MAPHRPTLEEFLARLEAAGIAFQLGRIRPDFVLVAVAVPGERWEVEFGGDGEIEVEIFRSDGSIAGAEAITDLLRRFAEPR